MNKKKAKKAIDEVARINGVSVEEVRREIEFSLNIARNSPDPKVREHWKAIPHKGEYPTLEEVIIYIAKRIK